MQPSEISSPCNVCIAIAACPTDLLVRRHLDVIGATLIDLEKDGFR